jgi:hypothetical protein
MTSMRHLLLLLAATVGLTACLGLDTDQADPRLTATGSAGAAFGATLLGTRKQLEFTLSNGGGGGVVQAETLGDIAVTVSGAGLTVGHTCPEELESGESCFITVSYAPTAAAAELAGELRVTSTADAQVQRLSGSAVEALDPAQGALRFDGSPVSDFDVAVGRTLERSYTVRNVGNADDAPTVTGPTQQGWTFAHDCPDTLRPAGTCTVRVRFAPREEGPSTPDPLVITDAYNEDYGGLTLRVGGVGR